MLKSPDREKEVEVAFVVVESEEVKLTKVVEPVIRRLPKVARPVVVIVLAPVLMLPKLEVMEPESKALTVVKDEVTTADPRVVAFNNEVPSME